jgi:hypothetical protein
MAMHSVAGTWNLASMYMEPRHHYSICAQKNKCPTTINPPKMHIPEEWVLQILMGDVVLVDSRYLPIENSASIKFLLSALSSSACIT